jgi:hypothetical protein
MGLVARFVLTEKMDVLVALLDTCLGKAWKGASSIPSRWTNGQRIDDSVLEGEKNQGCDGSALYNSLWKIERSIR